MGEPVGEPVGEPAGQPVGEPVGEAMDGPVSDQRRCVVVELDQKLSQHHHCAQGHVICSVPGLVHCPLRVSRLYVCICLRGM